MNRKTTFPTKRLPFIGQILRDKLDDDREVVLVEIRENGRLFIVERHSNLHGRGDQVDRYGRSNIYFDWDEEHRLLKRVS